MSPESQQSRLHGDQKDQKILFPEAAVSLTPNDLVVRAKTTSGGSAFTITLAPVAEMIGKIVSILMVSKDGGKDITIADKADDGGRADITFNLAADSALLYCDGFKYTIIASNGI